MNNLSPRQSQIVGLMATLPRDRGPLIPLLARQLDLKESVAANELVALYSKGAIRLGVFGFYV